MPEQTISTEEQVSQEESTGLISGIERNDYVDEKLKEFGVDVTEEETPEETKEELSESEKALLEAKKKAEAEEMEVKRVAEEAEAKKQAEQISQETAREQIEEKTGQEEEKFAWEKENREPTQKEVLDYIAQKADKLQQEREQERVKAEEAQKAEKAQKDADYRKAWETEWARQLGALEQSGHIAPIQNKDDKNDKGLLERAKIWEEAVKHNMMNLTEVYLLHILPTKGKQIAGANAPITRGTGFSDTSQEGEEEFFYDEIHGKDVDSEAAKMRIG